MDTPILSARKRLLKRGSWILAFSFLAGFAWTGGGCASLGRRLVLPGLVQGDPRAVLPADPDYEIVPLSLKDGTKLVGQFGRAKAPAVDPGRDLSHAPTVLFFYGSSQNLAAHHDQIVFQGLRAMGVNVFIPEFPGIGMSEGKASERAYYATADAALDYLLRRPDIDHARIIAAGQSLGTGTAFDLASRRPLAGLISVGGFTRTADAAMSAVHWMPGWFADSMTGNCRFDNLAKVKSVSCPILLIYGTADKIVPPWMADRLAAAAPGPVARLAVPSEHNSLWKSQYFGLNGLVRDWMQLR
jgi:uncharacterized protein